MNPTPQPTRRENREIKFRIWDNFQKIFLKSSEQVEILEMVGFNDSDKRMIWLQYTGLKDKNGKEIYEGDIVRAISMRRMPSMEVIWSKIMARFVLHYKNIWNDKKTDLYKCVMYAQKCEVIGNIYEPKI